MSKIVKRWLRRVRLGRGTSRRRERGQSLIIIVFVFIGILALVGLGIDLGLVYVERVRVSRAVDAAALAAVGELSLEPAARERAKIYLQENGYDCTDVNRVRLVIDQGYDTEEISGPSENEADTVIWIDTAFSRASSDVPAAGDEYSSANRIHIRVRKQVPMTFMQFVGFRSFPVEATAKAENIEDLDIVIVYDESGSMEFDTLCYGCWELEGEGACPENDDPKAACIYPLPWTEYQQGYAKPPGTPDHCAGWDSDTGYNCGSYSDYSANTAYEVNDCNYHHKSDDEYYIVIEAEMYSHVREEADYHRWGYTPFKTFWVMQRNDKDSYGLDSRGGYLSHHPYHPGPPSVRPSGLGVPCTLDDLTDGRYCRRKWSDGSDVAGGPFPAPRADYDFVVPDTGDYYVWVRGQSGETSDDEHIFWGLGTPGSPGAPLGWEGEFEGGNRYDGACEQYKYWYWNGWKWTYYWKDCWQWRCLGSTGDLNQDDVRTLHLWAGGAGFDVDRIVITSDSGNCGDDSSPPGYTDGYPANTGRTRDACEPCDPRFAGWNPDNLMDLKRDNNWWLPHCDVGANPDQRQDPIYEGEQPIRDALDAAINFVSLTDPRFDQVGYVSYQTSVNEDTFTELQCLRRLGPQNFGAAGCPDPPPQDSYDSDCGCYPAVITGTVIAKLNATYAGGSTNIAEGIRDGIEVLSTDGPCDKDEPDPEHCGRPGAAHIMVLLTDGRANHYPGCAYYSGAWHPNKCNTACPASIPCCQQDLWPDQPGESAMDSMAKDCVVYYAYQARNEGIVIYTIALGDSADQELMERVADVTGGYYRYAPTSDKLDEIFNELFEHIFLRLIH